MAWFAEVIFVSEDFKVRLFNPGEEKQNGRSKFNVYYMLKQVQDIRIMKLNKCPN